MTESRKNILELYADLRLADVRDGMDWVGLNTNGSVDQRIRPMTEGMHATGIARTVRMRPTQIQVPQMTPEEYTKWAYDFWYGQISPGVFANDIEDGDMIMVQSAEIPDVGELGSNNTLDWYANGARGIITSGGVRDRDECRMQNVPIWHAYFGQKMTQGRSELDAVQVPVTIGGQLVRPGDVVIADGDGVLIVPIEHAVAVAKYARQEFVNDKVGRRRIYEKMGRELDLSVL
jgi:4-hydroxy-4-methyl-2-oxoglutarate aldolase